MSFLKNIHHNERGFVLIAMLFLMILIAVTAVALNRRAGLDARISAGQLRAVQIRFDQQAVVEAAVWQLTQNPLWRTDGAGEDYAYNGTTYNRKVLSSAVSGWTDAVVVSVTSPGMIRPMRAAIRYYIYPLFQETQIDKKLHQVCRDSSNNIYFAVPDKHTIFRRNNADQQIIEVAGNGTSGFSGDGGQAVDAQLKEPNSAYVDTLGNIYVADTGNHCIRKINTSGDISTVAGMCTQQGSTGDTGPATDAKLDTPKGIYVDTAGNIYVADTENNRIRKFTDGGNITTVAGTGNADYSGDGGLAVNADLKKPESVFAGASGDIYIADTENNRIRKFIDGGNITTVAGTGNADYSGDGGLAVSADLNKPKSVFADASGDIYIVDTENNRIRKFIDGGNITTIAGTGNADYSGDGGPAVDAEIDSPEGVCLLSTGEVIISDTNNISLRQVSLGNISSLFSSSGLALNKAQKILMDSSGNLYIADSNNHRVKKKDTSGNITIVSGTGDKGYSGDGGPAITAKLDTPKGLALRDNGDLYIADTGNHCIRRVDTAGNISTVAGIGTVKGFAGDGGNAGAALLDSPEGVSLQKVGSNVRMYIADTGNHCIRIVSTAGTINTIVGTGTSGGFSGDGGTAAAALLDTPGDVVYVSDHYYIADTGNHCVRRVDKFNNISTVAGIGTQDGFSGDGGAAIAAKLKAPGAVIVDASENIFIADTGNHCIRVVSAANDNIYALAGSGQGGFNGEDQPSVEAKLNQPGGIAMAAVREGLNIYISDTNNNRIRVLNFKMVKEIYSK